MTGSRKEKTAAGLSAELITGVALEPCRMLMTAPRPKPAPSLGSCTVTFTAPAKEPLTLVAALMAAAVVGTESGRLMAKAPWPSVKT